MYSRTIGEETYSFGVSGKLIRNTLVMYDRQTGSLWSQLLGEAVEGPLRGTTLTYVPAVHVSWASWRDAHPDTLALVKGLADGQDPYQSYYLSNRTGVIGETFQDTRLDEKELVIGVAGASAAVAYPFSVLNGEPLIEDVLEERPLLVLFDAASGAGRVYDRTVGARS